MLYRYRSAYFVVRRPRPRPRPRLSRAATHGRRGPIAPCSLAPAGDHVDLLRSPLETTALSIRDGFRCAIGYRRSSIPAATCPALPGGGRGAARPLVVHAAPVRRPVVRSSCRRRRAVVGGGTRTSLAGSASFSLVAMPLAIAALPSSDPAGAFAVRRASRFGPLDGELQSTPVRARAAKARPVQPAVRRERKIREGRSLSATLGERRGPRANMPRARPPWERNGGPTSAAPRHGHALTTPSPFEVLHRSHPRFMRVSPCRF